MQAVILVGGQGTRLRPLTLTTPKPLVPLANRPVIEHIVGWLARYEVSEAILATQYQAAAFEGWLRRWRGIPVRTNEEPEPRGTAGAVAELADLLTGTTVVVNGDNILRLDLGAMLAAHRAAGAVATISTAEVDDPTGRGVVVTDSAERVVEFQEKPAPGTARARMINTGVYLLEPVAIATIPRNVTCSFEREVFPALIATGAHVQAFCSRNESLDTGTPAGYLRAQAAVLRGMASEPAGQRSGEVWREDSVTIDGAAHLSDGVAIGFGTMLASRSVVRGSSVGRECHVLPGARIENSAVWDGCMVEENATIRDSIVGRNCYIGKGAQLAGSMIGDGCIIRAGAVLQPGTTVAPETQSC